MKIIQGLDTSSARTAFVVANTPSFLLTRLRSDPAVAAARRHSEQELLQALKRAVHKSPKTGDDYVLPYILLVALAGKGSRAALEQAAQIEAPHHNWYKPIVETLIKTFGATSVHAINIPMSIRPATNTSTASSRTVITELKFPTR
jgi:hypothetical protein